jgi:hypothetical protein
MDAGGTMLSTASAPKTKLDGAAYKKKKGKQQNVHKLGISGGGGIVPPVAPHQHQDARGVGHANDGRSDDDGSSGSGGFVSDGGEAETNQLFQKAQDRMREMHAMQRAALHSSFPSYAKQQVNGRGTVQVPAPAAGGVVVGGNNNMQQLRMHKQRLLQQMRDDTEAMNETIMRVNENEQAIVAAAASAGGGGSSSLPSGAAPGASASGGQNPSASANADANDVVYKALMKHKKAELQKMVALASDTQTITDAMLRRHAEAQRTKIAVAACTHYATNAKYMEVNSGSHPKIRVFSGMHALNPDEVDVYSSLVECCPPQSQARVTVMHNHCMSDQGMIEGFRFTMSAKENHQYLPMNRRMFFRHSMVECSPSSPLAASLPAPAAREGGAPQVLLTSCQEDRAILELLLRQNEVKDRLVSIMQRLYKGSLNGMDADFDCMPMNMDVLDSAHASMELQGGGVSNSSSSSMAASFHARRTADCKKWNPEMPEVLGLYHAYVRGYNKDTR